MVLTGTTSSHNWIDYWGFVWSEDLLNIRDIRDMEKRSRILTKQAPPHTLPSSPLRGPEKRARLEGEPKSEPSFDQTGSSPYPSPQPPPRARETRRA